MAEIVPLRKGDIPTDPEIIDGLLKDIDELREKVLAGEIKGFSIAYVDGGDYLHTWWKKGSAGVSRLVGAVTLLQYRLAKAWDDEV